MVILEPQKNESYDSYINRILDSRKNKRNSGEYYERHHITPKCLGGCNDKDNLIYLYAQEHYFAHKLLALENPSNKQLQYAWWNMCHCFNDNRQIKVSSEDYALARQRFSQNISEQFAGENAYWYNKPHDEEVKRKISESLSGEKNPMFGKKHSDAVKKYISELNTGKRTGKDHPNARAVCCINTGEIFATAEEARKYCGLKNRSSITGCCSGQHKTAGTDPNTGEKLSWKYID